MSIFSRFGFGGDQAGYPFILFPVGAAAVWFGGGELPQSVMVGVVAVG
jgi:hypothetical protein